MAQTQRLHDVNDETAALDNDAWLEAATGCSTAIRDGKVWGYNGGMLFSIPAPSGFHLTPASMRRFVFFAAQNAANNRLATKTKIANVQDYVNGMFNGTLSPETEKSDAHESIYRKWVRETAVKQLGEDKVKAMTPATFDGLCDKYRSQVFDRVIARAIENAKNKPVPETKGRGKRAAAEVTESLEIGAAFDE